MQALARQHEQRENMKREELIDALESDAIKIDEDISSTNTPEPGNSEAMRIAVAKIKEKKTKNLSWLIH